MGKQRVAYYHVQKFSKKDGGPDSKLIVIAGNDLDKTL